jgi:prepilin-type N-terminal cleavage/methylation domain-containing protein
MICRRPHSDRNAFTLIELLAVITIIAIIAMLVGPVLSHFRKGDAMLAATRQMLDDVAAARQLAISQRTTVYMVFVRDGFWNNIPIAQYSVRVTNLCDKQLTGYSFISLRSVGDQPGQGAPRYLLSNWRKLPESIFIVPEKFNIPTTPPFPIDDPLNPGQTLFRIAPFNQAVVPFPTADAPASTVAWPCIAFNYLGQLISGQDEFIPLAHGSISYYRDPKTKALDLQPLVAEERPPNNSRISYNIIHIDWLTGRARLERRENQ